jgi:L-arabinose transport system ATP-binding protein
MQNGRITGELIGKEATEEAVLKLAMADELSTEPEGAVESSQE